MTPHSQNEQRNKCDQNQRIELIKSALNHIQPLHDAIDVRIQKIVFHFLGTPLHSREIIIADGLENGLAIYKSTGIPTAVGVGAKNISLVAKEISLIFPENEITICPDRKPSGAKSKYFAQIDKAAQETGAFVAYPWDSNKETYRTFFDVFISRGSDGVKNNIELAKHGFPQASICNREVRHG